jgi:hypothetical protein
VLGGDSGSVAAVSDFLHLRRIDFDYRRAGADVITVRWYARRIP